MEEFICKNCIYFSYDSWNNPTGYFCEWKTSKDNDFLVTRVNGEDVCSYNRELITGNVLGFKSIFERRNYEFISKTDRNII